MGKRSSWRQWNKGRHHAETHGGHLRSFEAATPKQIDFLVSLGVKRDEASKMSKSLASESLKRLIDERNRRNPGFYQPSRARQTEYAPQPSAPVKLSTDVAILHFDGSAFPNPGQRTRCGYILKYGSTVVERSIPLGYGTNNTAEFNGLIHGLREALSRGIKRVEVYGDSLLVIRGVQGGMKRKGKPHLEQLKAQVLTLIDKFEWVDLNWCPREENAEADEVCG